MHYLDRAQVEYWRNREAEERAAAAQAQAEARVSHLKMADSYAALISQTLGPQAANANE